MTKRKDLKRLVRERMARTGERYTEALARVRAETQAAAPDRPVPVSRIELTHDLGPIAAREGFACRAEVGVLTWKRMAEEEGSAEAFFAEVFAALRRVLVLGIGQRGPDTLRARLVHGAPMSDAGFVRELLELVHSSAGGRAVANGRGACFQVAGRERTRRVVVFLAHDRAARLTLTIDARIDMPEPAETWRAARLRYGPYTFS